MRSSIVAPWRLGDTIMGVTAVGIGGAGLLVLATGLEMMGATRGAWASLLSAAMLEGLLIITALAFSIRRYHCSVDILGFRSVRGYHFWLIPFVALFASLMISGIYTTIVKFCGIDVLVPPELSNSFEEPLGFSRLGLAFIVVVLAPIAEETFFRGFVLQGLTHWTGLFGASIGSSLLFALSHASVGMLIPVFLSGMILAWAFMKTRSLTPGIFAHSMQNSLAFMLAF